ncbi:MAG TPA: S9 family peptidase, partial [Thermomicrobiales bacterium]|nr:S9 family peptidase [Thermomicrobiales bacterium]
MTTVDTAAAQPMEDAARAFLDRPSFSSPVFLDSGTLAMLDDRSGVAQVSTVSLADENASIVPLTHFPERVLSLVSNGNGVLVFGMDLGGDERQQLWRFDSLTSEPVRLTHRPDAIHEPGAVQRSGRYVMFRSNARDESTFDVLGSDGDDGKADVWMTGAGQAMPVDVSADGQRALVIKSNTNLDADVLLLERSGSAPRVLTPHEGEAWVSGAAFHPDMSRVFLLTNEGTEFVRLEAIQIESGKRDTIVEDRWDVERFAISPDGRMAAVSVNADGWSRVAIHPLDGQADPIAIDLPRGTIDRFAWSPDSGTVVFGMSTATDPSHIVLAGLDGSLQHLGRDTSENRPPVVEPELIHYPSFDGRQIPAFFFRSPHPGPRPVLVEVHGGPESQRRLQYTSAVPTNQYIQSLGISVLSLNVRGSTGYGKEYSHLDDKDLRLDAVKDVAAAVDWLRERDDVIRDRIGIMGQSYGGYMTLAALCFHPRLWSAAVDVVGIANFVSFLERTGPWRRTHRSQEYGFLDQDREMLERISPLNHVDQIVAPLLVIHGRNDPRVPLFEAEQIVQALEERGRTVQLRVFDNEGHGLSRREN